MIDELVAGLVGNLPFAVVLVYFLNNYFRERKETLAMMSQVTKDFTATIRVCCGGKEKSEEV